MTTLHPHTAPNASDPVHTVEPASADAENTIEGLEPLDWREYRCQCAHHGSDGCDQRARWILTIHAISRCDDPGLDPDGNRIEIRCMKCVERLRSHIKHSLTQINQRGRAYCDTCGAPLVEVEDVLRSVRRL